MDNILQYYWVIEHPLDKTLKEEKAQIMAGKFPHKRMGWDYFWMANYYYEENDLNMYFHYSMRALEEKEWRGAINLGNYYQDENEEEKCIYYYELAIQNGELGAGMYLAIYYLEKTPPELNKFKECIMKNISKKHVPSMLILGKYYFSINEDILGIFHWKQALEIEGSRCLPYLLNEMHDLTRLLDFWKQLAIDFPKEKLLLFLGEYDRNYYRQALAMGYWRAADHVPLPFLKQIKVSRYLKKSINQLISNPKPKCVICDTCCYHNLYICGHAICYICFHKTPNCPFHC